MIDKATFFLGASDDLLRLFDTAFVTLQLRSGETLFEQGDHDERLFVLDEGVLEVSVYSANGRKLTLNQLHAGSVFGEIAMFDPGPRTARIEALVPCKLRAIRQSALIPKITEQPKLAVELLGLAGKRMRWLSQQMEDQVFLPTTARLAAKVLYLAGESHQINMAQAQLADFVGVTREIVSKTLSGWRRDGIVALSRGRIDLLDVDALKKIKAAIFS